MDASTFWALRDRISARISALQIESKMHATCGEIRQAIAAENQMIGLREAYKLIDDQRRAEQLCECCDDGARIAGATVCASCSELIAAGAADVAVTS